MATQTQMPERNRAPLSIAGLAKDSGRNTCNKRPPYRHSSPNMTTCISRIPVISNMNIWLAAFRKLELECEQIFERETAVKLLRNFAVEYGDVNPDVSYLRANCDGSLLKLPCCTANGFWAMPQVPNPLNDPHTAGLPLRLICWRLRAFHDSCEVLQISHRSDPGGSAMFRPAVVTHGVPSQTKEFSSHSVMCSSFRVALQIATARFCTPLQRVAMNTPRFRNSLPMPASPFVIDAATVAHLCGRSLQTWWSWHAAGRCPQPVTRPHQTLTVVVVRRDRRIRGLKKSTFKAIV